MHVSKKHHAKIKNNHLTARPVFDAICIQVEFAAIHHTSAAASIHDTQASPQTLASG